VIVVPAIDLRGGRAVRLVRGDPAAETVYSDDPVEVAKRFEADGAAMLHVVDLDAALGTGQNRDVVAAICRAVSIPVQAGGGLRSLEAVDRVLGAGASRAVLGTAAAVDPRLVHDVVMRHGDRIVAALDVRDGTVMVRGWQEPAGSLDVILPSLDVSRFLVTSIGVDGTLDGPDFELYERVLALTDRPVLASGGVGTATDLRALASLGVEGAIVGKALYEGALTLRDALEESRR